MFEATSWVTSASRDDDGTSDVDRMNAERLLSTNPDHSAYAQNSPLIGRPAHP